MKYWKISIEHNIGELVLDVPGQNQNVLSSEVVTELGKALDEIDNSEISALLIRSGKPDGFIAGADVGEFSKIESRSEAMQIITLAHRLFDRIESLSVPTVAIFNGHCLGGGLELALACDYRVSLDDPNLRIGLPEVKLGIHPGFGGTVRLDETIGVRAAMDLILTGRSVNPFVARKLGIVDFSVPRRQLAATAMHLVDKRPSPRRASLVDRILGFTPIRQMVALYFRRAVSARVRPSHYPAPYSVIDLWISGGDRQRRLESEQRSVADLVTSPTSRNLVRLFFLQENLKKRDKGQKSGQFNHVHIVGAGVMGGDIASWCALRGIRVTLHDRSSEALARATQRAHELFLRRLKQARLVERAMDRFQPDLDGDGARNADLVIEAIVENLDAKRDLFAGLDSVARADAILATNTSSIPLESIAGALSRPGRLVGLHFFNPVAKMQLVEVVRGSKTTKTALSGARGFAIDIGRLPVTVKSSPGFLVNRVLMPYALEAILLLEEGLAASDIDEVAESFGMPMGPVTMADTVGLDVCLEVARNLADHVGGEVPALLDRKVSVGDLGRKSGRGFYSWRKGEPQKGKSSNSLRGDVQERLVYRYLNECVACMDDGIVDNGEHLDAAMVFGTGFAPFTGGPLHYIMQQDPSGHLKRISQLEGKYGDRFSPADGWLSLANQPGDD